MKTNKKSLKIKFDKKGLPILAHDHDLYKIFEGEKKSPKEEFSILVEETLKDEGQQRLLMEKKLNSKNRKVLTTSERMNKYPSPQLELDLHGFTVKEAIKKTETLILNSLQKKLKTIKIIVGKGLHSPGKAVIRDAVENYILQLKRKGLILGLRWEKKQKNKSGAIILFLSSN